MSNILKYVSKNDIDGLTNYLEGGKASKRELNEGLQWTCLKGNEVCVQLLLKHGADPNYSDEFGTAVLHFAVRGGFQGIIVALLKNGAEYHSWSVEGEKLLHWACHHNYLDVVKVLLEDIDKQDSNEPDAFGHLAIHVAAINGRDEILAYLLMHNCYNVDVVDENGWTALQYACSEASGNYKEVLCILLKYRADPMRSTPNGKTALDLAYESGIANKLIDILTFKKMFHLLIHVDNVVPCPPIPARPTSTTTISDEPVKDAKVSLIQRHYTMFKTMTDEPRSRMRKENGPEKVRRGQQSGRDPDVRPLVGIVSHDDDASESQNKIIFSLWRKIIQNDDVELLTIYRDSNIWRDPNKPLPFDTSQGLSKIQLKRLFQDCYENGLAIFSFVEANFRSEIEQGNFKSVVKELSDLDSDFEEISSNDFILFSHIDVSLTMLSLITGRLNVLEQLIRMRQFDCLPVALLVILITRRLKMSHSFPEQVKGTLEVFSDKIEAIAVDILNRVFLIDNTPSKKVSLDMLHVPLKTYGNLSLIDLADKARCTNFLSLPCCQAVLDERWYGKLSRLPQTWRWSIYIMPPLYFVYLCKKRDTWNSLSNKSGSPLKQTHANVALKHGRAKAARRQELLERDQQALKNPCLGLRNIFHAPSFKFYHHSLMHIIFLACFSFVLLKNFHYCPSMLEILCISFIIGYALEDIRQCVIITSLSCFSAYIKEIRNWLDMSGIFFTVTGLIWRCFYISRDPVCNLCCSTSNYTDAFMIHEAHDSEFYTCRVFLLIGLLLFYVRILFIVTISPVLGPRLTMMGNMLLKDLLPLSIVFGIFILSFGIVIQALLYPNGQTRQNTAPMKHSDLYMLFRRSFYGMFAAEYPLEELSCDDKRDPEDGGCPNEMGSKLVLFLFHAVFVFSVNISLINLLIGLFSNTVARITAQSTAHWLADRYKMVEEYKQHSIFPPPFNTISCIIDVFYVCQKMTRKRCKSTQYKSKMDYANPLTSCFENDLDVIVKFLIIQAFALKNHRYQMGDNAMRAIAPGQRLHRGTFGDSMYSDLRLKSLEEKMSLLNNKIDVMIEKFSQHEKRLTTSGSSELTQETSTADREEGDVNGPEVLLRRCAPSLLIRRPRNTPSGIATSGKTATFERPASMSADQKNIPSTESEPRPPSHPPPRQPNYQHQYLNLNTQHQYHHLGPDSSMAEIDNEETVS